MSLENPTAFERFLALVTAYKLWFIGAGLLIVLVGTALYMTDCGSNWSFNRGVNQLQANVNKALDDATAIKKQADEIEKRKIEANANVNAAVKQLQDATFGLEDAKRETNQALANYNRALATNSNVDATKEDVLKVLEKLK